MMQASRDAPAPARMKAIVHRSYGPPSLLQREDVAVPEPRPGQVRVRVHATAVNDWDWSLVRGKPYPFRLISGLRKPKVPILGAELSGVVEDVGEGATRFRPGDRVYGDVSEAGFGGFGEYACVQETALSPMPDGMDFVQAAALPHAALLALQGLVNLGQIRRGERVLINGAGGGVGTLGLQIAKTYGCEVTGVDSRAKLGAMTALGFDHVIDYEQDDFTDGRRQYDLVLDAKTTRSPLRYLAALAPQGRYITVGGHLPRLAQALCMGPAIRRVTGKRVAILGLKPNEGLEQVSAMYAAGQLRCVVDGPHPLAEVPRQLERFGRGEHTGKIVIRVAGAAA